MRNPFRTRTPTPPTPTTYRVGDVHYDRRSAELLGAFDRPSRWQSWAGAMRRMMSPGNGNGREEQRAITSLPWVPFNQGNLIFPYGGVQVQDQALSLTPVFAAVQMIAGDVSTLPVKAYRKGGDQRIPMGSLPQLFAQLDDTGNLVDWLHRCMTSLLLWGNAYGLVTSRDGMQFPSAVMWLDPAHVTCDESNPAAPVWYWQGRFVPSDDMIHIPWFTVAGKVRGMSPIEAFATTMNVGLQAQDYTSGWFAAGGVPPGTFKNNAKTVNSDEAEIIKDRLVNAIRSRKPIVYGADWDYNPITIPPEQAQFVAVMKLTATQIAAVYNMPPEAIGGETGVYTYSTVEQNQTYYVSRTLRPWLVKLESAFSAVLPLRQYVKFNADALVRADMATRYSSYKTARDIGTKNVDEIRALEDQPPLPDGKGQDYTPLLVQVAASRGIDAAQVHAKQPLADQPGGQAPTDALPAGAQVRRYDVVDAEWDQLAIAAGPRELTIPQVLLRRRYEPDDLGAAARKFNPTEPRIPGGEGGGEWSAGGALKDLLKLAGKIDLDKDEQLLGSAKVDGERGGVRLALTQHGARRMLRFGAGPEGYGQRDRDNGIPAWDGNQSRAALSKAEHQRLDDEEQALDAEYDSATPARREQIDARLVDIREQLTAGDGEFNGTAKLDEYSTRRLADQIRPALAEAVEQEKVENAAWDEIEALQAKGNPDPARLARLHQITRFEPGSPGYNGITFTQGIISGSQWGDVHYSVELDDLATGVYVSLGVKPKDTPDDWGDDKDWRGYLDAADTRRLLRLLDRYSATGAVATRVAGHDVTPGHDQLHHYWTRGEGLAKWAESPHPWTALYHHLLKYMNPDEAKRTAAQWFHDVFGFWPGSDLNRVTHGHPPRGHKVGPG